MGDQSQALEGQESEAEILFPDRTVEIKGEAIEVREFTFRQGLELGPVIVELVAELDAVVGDGSDLSGLFDLLYAHPKALEQMILLSTGKDAAWFDELSTSEGERLIMVFWGVNGPFFVRRLAARRMAAEASRRVHRVMRQKPESQSSASP